jgi:TfoX/Sxy family transcriptional regulator of competence genes
MAYDEALAARVRDLLGAAPDVTEKRMFGGLAFLAGGHMAVAASGQGGLMVRVDPEATDALVARPGVRPFAMRGRPLDGWVRVDGDAVAAEADLAGWVERGAAYARSLPPKG